MSSCNFSGKQLSNHDSTILFLEELQAEIAKSKAQELTAQNGGRADQAAQVERPPNPKTDSQGRCSLKGMGMTGAN